MQRFLKELLIIIAFCVFFIGCNLFENGQRILNRYCPNFAITINGIETESYTKFNLTKRNSYILQYDSVDEEFVERYFHAAPNGFVQKKNNNFYTKDIDDYKFIENDDVAFGKMFKDIDDSSVVIFNQSKGRIIILEFLNK